MELAQKNRSIKRYLTEKCVEPSVVKFNHDYLEPYVRELAEDNPEESQNKEYDMHVLKKFYFDAQQKLQLLINPLEKPINISIAFAAALKLYRIAAFNAVVVDAVKQNKINDSQFTGFLDTCILSANATTNYVEAQKENLSLSVITTETKLKLTRAPLVAPLLAPQMQVDGLAQIDPLVMLRDDLTREYDALMDQPQMTITIPSLITLAARCNEQLMVETNT